MPQTNIVDQSELPDRRISPIRFLGALSKPECAKTIAMGLSQGLVSGEMYTPVEGYRESLISYIGRTPDSEWLYKKVCALGQAANREFGFEVDFAAPIIQYTQYSINGTIDWHTDYDYVGQNPRKVSISIQLSDPREYGGGELEFFPHGEVRWGRGKGTAIVFPSFVQHRVKPLTHGTRKSLVVWFSGPPFR